MSRARRQARDRVPAALGALSGWLAVPSVSGDPTRRDDVRRAAGWLRDRLAAAGARTWLLPSGPAPLVVGRFPGPVAAPLLVVYGHYDVQPPGPGWTSPPFRPTRRGDLLVARGASDDKGQLFAHVVALEAWQATGGLPCEVLVVAEGAEEVGSPGLAEALGRLTAALPVAGRPLAVVVSDTRRASMSRPSVTVSQRGALRLDLLLETGGAPVHAGRFGGALVDPGPLLGALLARAADQVARVVARPPAARSATRCVSTPSDGAVRAAAGGRAVVGRGLAERSTVHAALVTTRLSAGNGGGALPSVAAATVDVRLPPGVPPDRARTWLTGLLAARLPDDVRLTVVPRSATSGLWLEPALPVRNAVDEACRLGFGHRPDHVRSGGSIPAVAHLAAAFATTPVLLGLGPVSDGAHGPDEHLDVPGWTCSVDTCVALAATLGRNLVAAAPTKGRRRASLEATQRARALTHPGGWSGE